MTTSIESKLRWVQRNRLRREKARPVGAAVQQVIAAGNQECWGQAAAMASTISLMVDDEFRAHCRVALGPDGRLRINVDHPGLVFAMRSRWLGELMRRLDSGAGFGRRAITFGYGRDGYRLTAPPARGS